MSSGAKRLRLPRKGKVRLSGRKPQLFPVRSVACTGENQISGQLRKEAELMGCFFGVSQREEDNGLSPLKFAPLEGRGGIRAVIRRALANKLVLAWLR